MTEASGAPRADDGARCDPAGVVVDGVRIQAPFQHPDAPDPFGRLWTPHRMVYIGGQDKPEDASARRCPFCAAPGPGRTCPRPSTACGRLPNRTTHPVVRKTCSDSTDAA